MSISRVKIAVLLISTVYLATHLPSLTSLPVFSDEAIYIRWAQVAFRVPEQYAFLPMLDGKPPLHVWSMIPFLLIFSDPLFAGRLVSVLAGLATLYVVSAIVKELGGDRREQFFSMIIVLITPFWFFHHRMALAEALLSLTFSLGLLYALKLMRKTQLKYIVGFAVSFGASLWIKTTALFFIPVYALVPLLYVVSKNESTKIVAAVKASYIQKKMLWFVTSGVLAGMLFLLLKFSPLFPLLFSRSADYTFTFQEILQGEWRYIFSVSFPKVLFWIFWYMSPFLILIGLFGKKKSAVLWLMTLVFLAPLVLFGRVLSARYFFPVASLLTVAGVFGLRTFLEKRPKLAKQVLGFFIGHSLLFMMIALTTPSHTPFTPEDTHQYITEWSSGYGIPEARDFFSEKMKKEKIIVGTEGFFGTLPDGLQIYFDRHPLSHNIEIIGVGQPIHSLSEKLLESASQSPTFLLVNEHRFFLEIDGEHQHYSLIQRYPRPLGGPALLLLQIYE